MMLRVPRDRFIYRFAPQAPPVAEVDPGDRVVFETWDSSTGRVQSVESFIAYTKNRDPGQVNPAAGPVWVRGAEPGDGLAVNIESVELVGLGSVRVGTAGGITREGIEAPAALMVEVDGAELLFSSGVRLPARPMVGVIGTAPATGEVLTGHPGPIGSNLDCNVIAPGATVYLPVHVPGALLALGDVHASMGDGEVTGAGIEISANVIVRIELVKRAHWLWPWLETATSLATFGIAPTLDAAGRIAVERMVDLLTERLGVSRTTSFLLVGAAGDLRAGQAAAIPGIATTAYVVIAKPLPPPPIS